MSRWLPGRNRKGADLLVRATLAHLAFGAMAGAIYGALAPRRQPVVTGVGYAGAIWGTSYLGYLPALHLMPPPSEDDRARQVSNALAHAVFGIVLGSAMHALDDRCADPLPRQVEPAATTHELGFPTPGSVVT